MSETKHTPDRIRVAQDADGFWTCREAVSGSQEFVRAEIVSDMLAALKAAAKALGKAGGTALGVAVSGKDHPNPDEVLTDVFHDCNDADQIVRAAIAAAEGSQP